MAKLATLNYPDGDGKKGGAQKIDLLIGERLKELRKIKNLTQEDVAEKLGVSFQQIQKYENGKNRISFSKLYELSNFMKIPMESFVANLDGSQNKGLSDNNQSNYMAAQNDSISQKETDDLLKIYYSIEDPLLRKNLLKFIKTMAENLKS